MRKNLVCPFLSLLLFISPVSAQVESDNIEEEMTMCLTIAYMLTFDGAQKAASAYLGVLSALIEANYDSSVNQIVTLNDLKKQDSDFLDFYIEEDLIEAIGNAGFIEQAGQVSEKVVALIKKESIEYMHLVSISVAETTPYSDVFQITIKLKEESDFEAEKAHLKELTLSFNVFLTYDTCSGPNYTPHPNGTLMTTDNNKNVIFDLKLK